MNFHVIGVNHNSAPLEVRERLAVPEAQLPDAIRSLVQQPGVDEGMVQDHTRDDSRRTGRS